MSSKKHRKPTLEELIKKMEELVKAIEEEQKAFGVMENNNVRIKVCLN
jgi:hypothetical protein